MSAEERARAVREIARVLRPADASCSSARRRRPAFARLLAGQPATPSLASSGEANRTLEANGFGVVRTLAEREGQMFIEGIKPRSKG